MRCEESPADPAIRHIVVNFWVFATDDRDPDRFEHIIAWTKFFEMVRRRAH